MSLRADLLTKIEKADALDRLAAIKRMLAKPGCEVVPLTCEQAALRPDTFLDSPDRLPEE